MDSSIIIGQTGGYREDIEGFEGIEYMRCGPDNGFFPDLSQVGPLRKLEDARAFNVESVCRTQGDTHRLKVCIHSKG